jgi:transposase, IS5 family
VSLANPDARPIRNGKLGKPNEFGYVAPARRGHRQHPRWRPRLCAASGDWARQPGREAPAQPDRRRAGPPRASTPRGRPRRRLWAGPTTQTLAALRPTRTFISGRAEPGSRRTRRRLARYRTGCEGSISHLKRGYELRRSCLKGDQGQRIWTGWAVLAYNLDTLAIHTT